MIHCHIYIKLIFTYNTAGQLFEIASIRMFWIGFRQSKSNNKCRVDDVRKISWVDVINDTRVPDTSRERHAHDQNARWSGSLGYEQRRETTTRVGASRTHGLNTITNEWVRSRHKLRDPMSIKKPSSIFPRFLWCSSSYTRVESLWKSVRVPGWSRSALRFSFFVFSTVISSAGIQLLLFCWSSYSAWY